jgi:hypothetical protein
VCLDPKEKKSANIVVSEVEGEISIYINSLPTLCFHLSGGWTMGLIFMCGLMFLCFLLIRSVGLERIPCVCSCCWYGHSELHFGKDDVAKERVTCSLLKKESS